MSDLLRDLPPLLAAHLELALLALAIAAAISLPLAIAVSARPRIAFPIVTAAGIVQTVPSLALLALMVPVLARTGWLSPFGFPPALIALTLYAILPILRNAITGLRNVDPAAREAGRGMGMSPWQLVHIVELPLAAPVIAAGLRTATVWTVGAATLATPVGQPCLGNYIFAGLQTRNFTMLLVGVAAAAALAVILDALLGAAEHALAGRRKRRVLVPIAGLAILILFIALLPRLVAPDARTASGASRSAATDAITYVRIGGKTFTEQYILAELLAARLAQTGIASDVAQSLGSTVVFDALTHNDIDVYVDYSGTLWTNIMKRSAGPPRWQVLAELEAWLARTYGVRSLGALGFENTYALAVRRTTADRLGLRTLEDLARHPDLTMGGDYEFFGRAEWTSVQRSYGLHFARTTTFDPSLLYEALVRDEIDVISAFSSDGRIAAYDLVALDDPLAALPPYDAMILLGPRVADDRHLACSLGGLHIDVALMRRANALVDRDGKTPRDAASWLLEQLALAPCREP